MHVKKAINRRYKSIKLLERGFSEKETDGSVSFYSAADFDTATLRKDASLINAYKTGRLGARPNLGSPYLVTKVE